jgi:hypothetical protein
MMVSKIAWCLKQKRGISLIELNHNAGEIQKNHLLSGNVSSIGEVWLKEVVT